MPVFFSPSTAGFYDGAIHAGRMPEDARPITAEAHAALIEANSQGAVIAADKIGNPVAVSPAPSAADALRRLRNRRDRLLRDTDHTQAPDFPISGEQRAAWAAYRQQLRDLPENATDLAAVTWPDAPAHTTA